MSQHPPAKSRQVPYMQFFFSWHTILDVTQISPPWNGAISMARWVDGQGGRGCCRQVPNPCYLFAQIRSIYIIIFDGFMSSPML
jgi:hypothetical protein